MYCRLASQELSNIAPVLQQNNVRLVGVGLEELGVEEFVEKKFWSGELYIDQKKEAFNALGFKRISLLSLPGMLISRIARRQNAKAKERGVGGDLKGDGFQNGGLVVVEKGGKVLYSFVQENVADHAENEDILKALKLNPAMTSTTTASPASAAAPEMTCTDDVCSLPPKKD